MEAFYEQLRATVDTSEGFFFTFRNVALGRAYLLPVSPNIQPPYEKQAVRCVFRCYSCKRVRGDSKIILLL